VQTPRRLVVAVGAVVLLSTCGETDGDLEILIRNPIRGGIEDRVIVAGMALSGQDEDMGRAIVATLAWGTACEALGHAHAVAEVHPSELAVARAKQRVQRCVEHAKYSTKLWRGSV
jgi:hypothetical protein